MSRAGETNGDGKAHKEGAEVHRRITGIGIKLTLFSERSLCSNKESRSRTLKERGSWKKFGT